MTATRTPVNPWSWSLGYGFNQAELVESASRLLVLSGQGPAAADGTPQYAGDPLRCHSASTTSRPCLRKPG
jgi:hypothetical protein